MALVGLEPLLGGRGPIGPDGDGVGVSPDPPPALDGAAVTECPAPGAGPPGLRAGRPAAAIEAAAVKSFQVYRVLNGTVTGDRRTAGCPLLANQGLQPTVSETAILNPNSANAAGCGSTVNGSNLPGTPAPEAEAARRDSEAQHHDVGPRTMSPDIVGSLRKSSNSWLGPYVNSNAFTMICPLAECQKLQKHPQIRWIGRRHAFDKVNRAGTWNTRNADMRATVGLKATATFKIVLYKVEQPEDKPWTSCLRSYATFAKDIEKMISTYIRTGDHFYVEVV
eukprot:755155-Hanusia_phi.AAC.4